MSENKKISVFAFLKNAKNKDIIFACLLAVVVLVLFFSSSVFSNKKTLSNNEVQTKTQNGFVSATEYCASVEHRLEKILMGISCIKQVDAMVMVDASPQISIYENIEETKNNNQTTIKKEGVVVENGNVSSPIIIVERVPNITGVLIVCQGLSPNKKLEILNAVQVVLSIDASKIEVLEG